jgi:hypothetical protein
MKANMAYVFIIILAAFFACSHSGKVRNLSKTETIHSDASALKNIAFCECIERSLPISKEQKQADGSKSGYFQLSNLGEEEIDTTIAFVQTYLDTVKYYSATNSNLGMMKCINLYNSNELESFVRNVLKE